MAQSIATSWGGVVDDAYWRRIGYPTPLEMWGTPLAGVEVPVTLEESVATTGSGEPALSPTQPFCLAPLDPGCSAGAPRSTPIAKREESVATTGSGESALSPTQPCCFSPLDPGFPLGAPRSTPIAKCERVMLPIVTSRDCTAQISCERPEGETAVGPGSHAMFVWADARMPKRALFQTRWLTPSFVT